MQALQEFKPKKIIQKKIARRERMARLARLRHRREKNVFFAQVQDLDLPPKYQPQNMVYENIFGLMISESDDTLDTEISLLNGGYNSNSVIVQNDTSRVLSIKLHKNGNKGKELDDQILNEWEGRNDPYWVEWARHIRHGRQKYQDFLNKYKYKFDSNEVDEDSLNKHKSYAAKRDELMSKKACAELIVRFNDKGSAASELVINAAFVNRLNYDFEEYIQKILVEGIPQVSPSSVKKVKKLPTFELDIEGVFHKDVQVTIPDALFVSKNLNLKKIDMSLTVGGYFVKNAAEMSFLVAINDNETLLEGEPMNKPIYRLYMEQRMVHEAEKKYFIEMYYRDQMAQLMMKPMETCGFRARIDKIKEESSEKTDINSIENIRVKEEANVKCEADSLDKVIKTEHTDTVPYASPSLQFMTPIQIMKSMYNTQNIMGRFLQQNLNHFLAKQEE